LKSRAITSSALNSFDFIFEWRKNHFNIDFAGMLSIKT
jgi:hypothetical protein